MKIVENMLPWLEIFWSHMPIDVLYLFSILGNAPIHGFIFLIGPKTVSVERGIPTVSSSRGIQ